MEEMVSLRAIMYPIDRKMVLYIDDLKRHVIKRTKNLKEDTYRG